MSKYIIRYLNFYVLFVFVSSFKYNHEQKLFTWLCAGHKLCSNHYCVQKLFKCSAITFVIYKWLCVCVCLCNEWMLLWWFYLDILLFSESNYNFLQLSLTTKSNRWYTETHLCLFVCRCKSLSSTFILLTHSYFFVDLQSI